MDLKSVRESKNLTQVRISELVGVRSSHLSMIENGIRRPSPELARKLAEILDVKWTDFFE